MMIVKRYLIRRGINMFKALLVDDERVIVDNLLNTVPWKEFGFDEVGTAGGGADALEWMAHNECHLLITDIRMPEMDGLALLKTVRPPPSRHSLCNPVGL